MHTTPERGYSSCTSPSSSCARPRSINLRAETLARGRCDGRAVTFAPVQDQPIAGGGRLHGPGNRDGSRIVGEGAVFERVGGQLVKSDAEGERRLGEQPDVVALDRKPLYPTVGDGERLHSRVDQVV